MVDALALTGNPSSVHAEGRQLRALIEQARSDVASLIGARPADVIFTSGATESNATALAMGWSHVFASGTEHESILAPLKASAIAHTLLPVHESGEIDTSVAEGIMIAASAGSLPLLLAVQLANNETGVIQPVAKLACLARSHRLFSHCDAVQAVGRIAIDINELSVDMLALSAHKMGGPKGVGALIVRDRVAYRALIAGGGQERRRRAGTENAAAIAGFGAAARVAARRLDQSNRIAALRDELECGVKSLTPDVVILSAASPRIGNTSCIALRGNRSDVAVIKLDLAGLSVSAGSACSSGKVGPSHVLAAMGIAPDLATSAIRISLGPASTPGDIEAFLRSWADIHTSGPSRNWPEGRIENNADATNIVSAA